MLTFDPDLDLWPCVGITDIYAVVGHTSFFAKVDLTKFGVLYKDRTHGSDPSKGYLSKWRVVEVDLENNSQNTQPNFNFIGGNWRGWEPQNGAQRPEIYVLNSLKDSWSICVDLKQSIAPITYF